MLDVNCPLCQKLLQVAEAAVDHDSQCPACATVFRPIDTPKATIPNVPSVLADQRRGEHQDHFDELAFLPVHFAKPLHRFATRWTPAHTILCAMFAAFVSGCLASGFLALFQSIFVRVELMHIPSIGAACAICTLVVGSMLVSAKASWQRCLRTIPLVSVQFFAAICSLYVLTLRGARIEDISIAVWTALAISVCCCPAILILEKMIPPLASLRAGFLKAAGRPTRLSTRRADPLRFDNTLEDEEFP